VAGPPARPDRASPLGAHLADRDQAALEGQDQPILPGQRRRRPIAEVETEAPARRAVAPVQGMELAVPADEVDALAGMRPRSYLAGKRTLPQLPPARRVERDVGRDVLRQVSQVADALAGRDLHLFRGLRERRVQHTVLPRGAEGGGSARPL